jgi:hypothetical protein
MKTHRLGMFTFTIILALITAACGTLQLELEPGGADTIEVMEKTESPALPPEVLDTQATPIETDPTMDPTTQRVTFDELGISLEVPSDLYIQKDPSVSYDDPSTLESYLFYIQNYGYPGGPSSGDFQMYGHLQYGPFMITSWEDFSNNTINSPMNAYANYIEIDGLKGYDTQLSGQRNRFVYLFHLDGHVLSIAVSEPTPENKALADQIIQSLELIPGGFTDASHVNLVSDPNQLFQIFIPEDWDYTFQPTIGTQLSSFEATSPDLEVIIEDVEGPHSNIYYKKGISLHLQVLQDDIELQMQWPNQREYRVYFNGIEGTVYIYREPSTTEGEIRTASVSYEGKIYLLRFGYAEDADLATIDRIISSFNITPETFRPSG